MIRRRLNPQPRPAALDDVLLLKLKLGVVFVNVVLLNAIRQSTHNIEAPLHDTDPTRSVKHFLRGVLTDELQRIRIVDIHPRVGISQRIVEAAEVHRDVQLPALETQVAMMVDDGNLLQHTT